MGNLELIVTTLSKSLSNGYLSVTGSQSNEGRPLSGPTIVSPIGGGVKRSVQEQI
jgi:hypothetical protein